MVRIWSFLIFLLYKALEGFIFIVLVQRFNLRWDPLAVGFYGLLSLFQAAFAAYGSFSRGKSGWHSSILFQYTSMLLLAMSWVVYLFTASYLWYLENDLSVLLLIGVALTSPGIMFYVAHSAAFSPVIKRRQLKVDNVRVLPTAAVLIWNLLFPPLYLTFKVLHGRISSIKLNSFDILLVSGVLIANTLAVVLIFIIRSFKAKRTASLFKAVTATATEESITLDDPNEFGYIQSEIRDLAKRLTVERQNLTLYPDDLSRSLKEQIARYGVNLYGEKKQVTAAAFRYHFDLPEDPERALLWSNRLARIFGEYARDYDAMPYFYPGRVLLIFGLPYHYEHQKYNALESSQKILSDLARLKEEEEFPVLASAGITTGEVTSGGVALRGPSLKEYTAYGSALENADRIALAAENAPSRLLCDQETLKGLEKRFPADKAYKIKQVNGSETLVYSIKN